MDLLNQHTNCLNNMEQFNICYGIENQQEAYKYVNHCLKTDLTNINNYNTINFEKLIAIKVEFSNDLELQNLIKQVFEMIACNYKFKIKKKHYVHLNK